jgi:hypothetical protein
MERAVRTLLHLPVEIATAFFFAASIGIGSGVATTSFTHRLGDGFKVAILAFLVAAAGFGYAIWRSHRPQRKLTRRRLSTVQMAVSR